MPSQTYWRFVAGGRVTETPTIGAVAVPDSTLTGFPVVQAVAQAVRCVVPHLHRMSVAAAQRALARAHCSLGATHRPRHVARGHLLRVHGQSPGTGAVRTAGTRGSLVLL